MGKTKAELEEEIEELKARLEELETPKKHSTQIEFENCLNEFIEFLNEFKDSLDWEEKDLVDCHTDVFYFHLNMMSYVYHLVEIRGSMRYAEENGE